jgi:hypothetical protein
VHTFSTKFFERLAHQRPRMPAVAPAGRGRGGVRLLGHGAGGGDVRLLVGGRQAIAYLDSRNFTEPMFVFAIMVIAGTRAVLQMAGSWCGRVARLVPLPGRHGLYFRGAGLVPLLGSFITEPAAMTLAALMLRDGCSAARRVQALKYATLGVLFVNISIGGTLTPFRRAAGADGGRHLAAGTWPSCSAHFGWKAALAVLVNAAGGDAAVPPRTAAPAGTTGAGGGAARASRRGAGAPGVPGRHRRLCAPPGRCSWACSCSSWALPPPTRSSRTA